jgi:hypothetical protein
MQAITRFLEKTDVFGTQITLVHRGRREYKSVFGGILTIIAAIFLILFVVVVFINPSDINVTSETFKELEVLTYSQEVNCSN